MRRTLSFALPVLLALAPTVACVAAAPAPHVPPGYERVAHVHQSRCGSCHVRVEPGERTRAELSVALERHRRRLRLSEEEWTMMVEYLAPRGMTGDSTRMADGRAH